MPTSRPRHSITETPALAAALEPRRERLGTDAPTLAELVLRGAESKLRELEALGSFTPWRCGELPELRSAD